MCPSNVVMTFRPLTALPAASVHPWRNSGVVHRSCSTAHVLQSLSQRCSSSPSHANLILGVSGRSVTVRLPSRLHAVKRNGENSSQENPTSTPKLLIPRSTLRRAAGGRGSTAGRGDGLGGDGGAGRGRVRRPDPDSTPAQVRGPGPGLMDSGSAALWQGDVSGLSEERAGSRRTGNTEAASTRVDKVGARRDGGPDPLRVAAERSDGGSDQEQPDTDQDPSGGLAAGSGRPRTAGGMGSGSRSSSSSSSDGRPARPGPGGVPGLDGNPRDLRTADDLPSLAARLERHAETWSREGDVRILTVAFNKLGKMGTPAGRTGPSSHLTATAFRNLTAAYLPLVPDLPDARSCVETLMACARLGRWGEGLALALVQRLGARGKRVLRRKADAQSHANLWWALSARGAPREVVIAAAGVLRESAACLLAMEQREMGPQDCSNVLLSCARLRWYKEPNLVHHLTTCLVAMPDANCQDLANALYSLGKLAEECGHQPGSQDLEGLAQRVVARLEGQSGGRGAEQASFNPQLLSNMLLGCAKLGYGEPRLLLPLAAAAGQAAHRSNNQDLANSLYALAKLGCTGAVYAPAVRSLCDAASELLKRAPERFTPQDLSQLLWALEGLRPEGFEMYAAALAAECSGRAFSEFKSHHFSNTIWAVAKMDSWLAETAGRAPDQGWYEAALEAAMRPGAMKGANPQDWSNLLYGLALVRHRPPEGLLRAMAAGGERGSLEALCADAASQACVSLLWALAVLGLWSEQELVDALAGRLGELLEKDPGQATEPDLTTSLWALAVMGPEVLVHRHGALVAQLLGEVAGRLEDMEEGPMNAEGLDQLWQVQQELEHTTNKAAAGGDSSVRDLAGILTASSLFQGGRPAQDSNSSQLQRQVAKSLEGLQRKLAEGAIISVRQECEVEGLGCRVDVLVELAGGRQVAVEVDGPSHFLANDPHTEVKDGSTQLRDRQLERVFGAGNVVSVPYWEWDKRRTEVQRQMYLCGLLGLG